jgi:hypothetical protein
MNEGEFAQEETKVRLSIYNQGYREGLNVAIQIAIVSVIGWLALGYLIINY